MDWIDAVLSLLGVLSLAAFGFSIRLSLGVRAALAELRIEIAKDYATTRALDKVQERIMEEIKDLSKKFDRLFEQRRDGR